MSILNIFRRRKHSLSLKQKVDYAQHCWEVLVKNDERRERVNKDLKESKGLAEKLALQRHLQLIGKKIPLCRCMMCKKPTDLLTHQEIAATGWLWMTFSKPDGNRLMVQLCPDCLQETMKFWGLLDEKPDDFHEND